MSDFIRHYPTAVSRACSKSWREEKSEKGKRFKRAICALQLRRGRALSGRWPRSLEMYALNVVPHVVDSAEDPLATLPFAHNARVVLGFVPCQILLAGEASARGLRAALMSAEEGLGVTLVMLPQIAATCEDGLGGASGIRAGPGAILVQVAVSPQVRRVGAGGNGARVLDNAAVNGRLRRESAGGCRRGSRAARY